MRWVPKIFKLRANKFYLFFLLQILLEMDIRHVISYRLQTLIFYNWKMPSQLKPVSLLHGPGSLQIIFTPWVKFKLCKLPWAEIKGFYLSSLEGLGKNGLGGLKIKVLLKKMCFLPNAEQFIFFLLVSKLFCGFIEKMSRKFSSSYFKNLFWATLF